MYDIDNSALTVIHHPISIGQLMRRYGLFVVESLHFLASRVTKLGEKTVDKTLLIRRQFTRLVYVVLYDTAARQHSPNRVYAHVMILIVRVFKLYRKSIVPKLPNLTFPTIHKGNGNLRTSFQVFGDIILGHYNAHKASSFYDSVKNIELIAFFQQFFIPSTLLQKLYISGDLI
jgi:hypothetical protein